MSAAGLNPERQRWDPYRTVEARAARNEVPRSKRVTAPFAAAITTPVRAGILMTGLAILTLAPLLAAEPEIRFDALNQSVTATGLDPTLLRALVTKDLRPSFGVFLGDAQLPILGDYKVSQSTLQFKPRFPFLAGRAHRVQLDLPGLYKLAGLAAPANVAILRTSFSPPEAPAKAPKTAVTGIYPTAESLPANTLRFYIYFSEPMTRQNIARHIRLEQADGNPVKGAFLEMENGLWDPESKRLTVFLHPGRIKRGLALHEREGPPLEPGIRYRLLVDRAAEDEDGQPLLAPFVKEFTVKPAVRTKLEPSQWKLEAPASGTRDSFALTVDRPLDEALFARVVHIRTAEGENIRGQVKLDQGETRWLFTPYSAWQAGGYFLIAEPELEDPAGNRLTRPFDQEIHGDSHRDEITFVMRPFKIR